MTRTEWVEQRLAKALERVRTAVEPGRHDAVLGAAASVADYVAAGALVREEVETELLKAAETIGLGGKRRKEAARCIEHGLGKGDPAAAWWPEQGGRAPQPRRYRWVGGQVLESPPAVVTSTGAVPTAPLLRPDTRITFFRGRLEAQGTAEVWTWDQVAEAVADPLDWPGAKEDLGLWSWAEYEGDSRAKRPDGLDDHGHERERAAHIEAVHALVLDYDDDPTFSMTRVAEWWGEVAHVAHTTGSHLVGKGKKAAQPRGRVILALTRAVTEQEFGLLAEWVVGLKRGQLGMPELRNPRRAYFLPARGPGGYEHAVHLDAPALDVDAVLERAERERELEVQDARAREPEPRVLAELQVRKDGTPTASLRNLVAVLDGDTRWQGRLTWCEFSRRDLLDGRPVTDPGETEVAVWLGEVYGIDASAERVHQAASAVCARHPVHPIRDYLDGLTWDGEQRLEAWLLYAGCEDTEDGLTSVYGTRWLVSAVARAYEPGCQADAVLILAGAREGTGKTSTFRVLAGTSNHSETALHIGDKDAYQQLDGVWIYELGELDSLRRSELSAIKAYITTTVDRYRPSYGRNLVDRPRQCVFAGTTNDAQFLAERGRRWWVRRIVQPADLRWLVAHRDQLWAEAVHLYRQGLQWWLTGDEQDAQEQDVEAYRHVDPWEEPIRSYLAGRPETTSAELLELAIRKPTEHRTRADEMRLAGLLRGLGWRKGKDYRGRSVWRA